MSNKLQGKIALITGGTTGIGAATARLFQAEGATVIVTGANPTTLEAARTELPGVEVIGSDAGDTAATKALIDTVKAKHGRIDILQQVLELRATHARVDLKVLGGLQVEVNP